MRKTVFSTVATVLVIATASLTGPAAATDTGKAVGICLSRGPDCTTSNNKDGSLHICVNNTGGQQCVNCPGIDKSGDCTVAMKGGGRNTTVEGILRQSKGKAR